MLRGTNGRARLPRPFLILLDLNMPRMDGIEFLQALRQDSELKKSVVFIMTTSGAEEDKVKMVEKITHRHRFPMQVGYNFFINLL